MPCTALWHHHPSVNLFAAYQVGLYLFFTNFTCYGSVTAVFTPKAPTQEIVPPALNPHGGTHYVHPPLRDGDTTATTSAICLARLRRQTHHVRTAPRLTFPSHRAVPFALRTSTALFSPLPCSERMTPVMDILIFYGCTLCPKSGASNRFLCTHTHTHTRSSTASLYLVSLHG